MIRKSPSMIGNGFWRPPKTILPLKEMILIHHVPISYTMTIARTREILASYAANVDRKLDESHEFKFINIVLPMVYNTDEDFAVMVEIDVMTIHADTMPKEIVEKLVEVQKIQQEWILKIM